MIKIKNLHLFMWTSLVRECQSCLQGFYLDYNQDCKKCNGKCTSCFDNRDINWNSCLVDTYCGDTGDYGNYWHACVGNNKRWMYVVQ